MVEATDPRRTYRAQPVDADALAEQQRVDDALTQALVLSRLVNVADSLVGPPV